ncbi:MAG: hypothetical protein RR782_08195 [Clostridium sp.]
MKRHSLLQRQKKKSNVFIIFIIVCISLVLSFLVFNLIINSKYKKVRSNEAFNRAMDMINYVWDYNDENYKILPPDIKLPYFLSSSGRYIGIPYCYGGQTSLKDSNLEGVSGFEDGLNKGFVPGNINTKVGYVDNTIGVDCSGFVNVVFNIKERTSTRTMDKYFKEINLKKLKPMDILNSKGKHVYIYLGKTNKGVMILESTSNGDKKYKDKTVVNYKSASEFKKDIESRGYVPMRYKNIKFTEHIKLYDKYEYNNSEKNAYIAKLNENISSEIDYLEDVDYYLYKNVKEPFKIKFKEFSNINIKVYNNKSSIEIKDPIETLINLKGNVYIKIEKGNNLNNNSKYSFKAMNS